MSDDLNTHCVRWAEQARGAAFALATVARPTKDAWLHALADRLLVERSALAMANERDLAAAPSYGLSAAQVDRLRLTEARIRAAAEGLRQVAGLPDPVGRVLEGGLRPNGLQVTKVAVPLGVIFFLYESRPNVTLDAAALCVKSGNAVILRGGKEAAHSNAALYALIANTLAACGLPAHVVQLVDTPDRAAVGHLLKLNEHIDLVIPRGGEALIRRVVAEATMPVLKHYLGNCHVYIDAHADADMAERIIINAKCQRPGVCNAAESLLLHRNHVDTLLPRLAQALTAQQVQLRGCPTTCARVPSATPASEADYAAEFLDLILSVKVVDSLDDAIAHIHRYGSRHTEAIVTNDYAAAQRFTARVDASAVLVNASTRFNDGFELGLGAEIGISTDKLHARGPCGLQELTTYKYVIHGMGQIRQ
jgi:glutamate-5-semialdehyde dehydrogenase